MGAAERRVAAKTIGILIRPNQRLIGVIDRHCRLDELFHRPARWGRLDAGRGKFLRRIEDHKRVDPGREAQLLAAYLQPFQGAGDQVRLREVLGGRDLHVERQEVGRHLILEHGHRETDGIRPIDFRGEVLIHIPAVWDGVELDGDIGMLAMEFLRQRFVVRGVFEVDKAQGYRLGAQA